MRRGSTASWPAPGVPGSVRHPLALVAALAALALAGCAGPAPVADEPAGKLLDVHALAVDPEDPDTLYVATHGGLARAERDGNWTLVGASRDDLMGLHAMPLAKGRLLASGHPPGGGNLGLRESLDGGRTWTTRSLEGRDLHAIASPRAQPDHVYAYAGGLLLHSSDGGRTWDAEARQAPAIRALESHALDPLSLWAATPEGARRTTDAGATWTTKLLKPATGLAFDAHFPGTGYVATPTGLWRTDDEGETWSPLPYPEDEVPVVVALHPHARDVAYVAAASTAIHKTTDGGQTWTRIRAP